jgi:inner membrane protein
LDNLTHSLAGAVLGQMGLKRLTGRATATLIIAANLPDIDAVATVLGTESLAIRRGITHGPIALLLLPLLLTGLVLVWERWRPNQAGVPVRAGPLLLIAYIGTLSHPALDWLNSYGIRLLEPFSSRWYAGDTLFIIDVWIWTALIVSFFWSRRREKRGGNWQRPAWLGFTAICAYIFANGLITARAEALGQEAVARMVRLQPVEPMSRVIYRREATPVLPPTTPMVRAEMVVANPQPGRFWRRSVLWRGSGLGGELDYDWLRERDGIILEGNGVLLRLNHPALAAARERPDVRAFLFWSRMPFVTEENGRILLKDQRFASSLRNSAGRAIGSYDPFTVDLTAPAQR